MADDDFDPFNPRNSRQAPGRSRPTLTKNDYDNIASSVETKNSFTNQRRPANASKPNDLLQQVTMTGESEI